MLDPIQYEFRFFFKYFSWPGAGAGNRSRNFDITAPAPAKSSGSGSTTPVAGADPFWKSEPERKQIVPAPQHRFKHQVKNDRDEVINASLPGFIIVNTHMWKQRRRFLIDFATEIVEEYKNFRNFFKITNKKHRFIVSQH